MVLCTLTNQIDYGRDTSLEKINANVISGVSPLNTTITAKLLLMLLFYSQKLLMLIIKKIHSCTTKINVKPIQLEHTFQRKRLINNG